MTSEKDNSVITSSTKNSSNTQDPNKSSAIGEDDATFSSSARLLFKCFAVSVFLVALLSVFFVPSFMTNDDPAMLLIASGQLFNSTPDEHLLFINVVVGGGLRWLYENAPSMPWYSIYMYFNLCMATALTLAACLQLRPSRAVGYMIWMLVLLILARFAMSLQFTVVAIWLSWASIAWILIMARNAKVQRTSILAITIGIIGIALAGLVRPDGAALGVLMAAPLILWTFKSSGKRATQLSIAAIATGSLIVFGFTVMNSAYYAASLDWEQFYSINKAKTHFVDNNLIVDGQATTEAFQKVNWSTADYDMLQNWFYVDENIFSLDKMNSVIESASKRTIPNRLYLGIKQLATVPSDALLVIAITLLVILKLTAPKKVWIWMSSVGVWYIVMALLVAVIYRPMPPRLYLPCLAIIVFSGLLFASVSKLKMFDVASRKIIIVTLFLLFTPALVMQTRSILTTNYQHTARVEMFRNDWNIFSQQQSKLIAVWGAALPYELIVRPLRENTPKTEKTAVLSLSTLSPTPFTKSRLREANIDDLHIALIDNPDITLIAQHKDRKIFAAFLKHRYNRDIIAQSTFLGKTFTAVQFIDRSQIPKWQNLDQPWIPGISQL